MKPTILYIKNQNDTVAIVDDAVSIAYNIETINKELIDEFTDAIVETNEATTIVLAGKYICVASVSIEEKVYAMMLFDFKGNEAKFIMTENTFDSPEIKALFRHRWNELKQLNPATIKPVHLVIGKPPQQ